MATPTDKRSTNLDQLNQEDWDALTEMFEALESVPVERIENGASSNVASGSESNTETDNPH